MCIRDSKQTALYLRKKGVDIYCIEFKWFQNNALEKMITCDFIIGEESYIKGEVKSKTQLPKVNEITFLESVDENGKEVFERIFKFAESNGLSCRWGSKGFSLNLPIESSFVGLCLGYPPESVSYTHLDVYKRQPYGRDPKLMGYPLRITELIAMLPGTYYVTRQAVYKPAYVRKAKKAIRKAFENQKLNKGVSFVEIVSNCNSGWKMTPVEANKWLEENMLKTFPLGDIKVDGELVKEL